MKEKILKLLNGTEDDIKIAHQLIILNMDFWKEAVQYKGDRLIITILEKSGFLRVGTNYKEDILCIYDISNKDNSYITTRFEDKIIISNKKDIFLTKNLPYETNNR